MTINPFLRLSYFEMFALGGFISRFPTTASEITNPLTRIISPLNNNGAFFSCGCDTKVWSDSFDSYMRTLADNNFGLCDLFWWLPPQLFATGQPIDSALLWKYVSSTEFALGEVTKHHQVITIKNSLHPEFSVVSFYKDTPLPGEAIDVVPCFVTPSGKMYSALGYKKESPRIPIRLGSGEVINVLHTGIFGNVIFGEHLLPSEKSSMDKLRVQFEAVGEQPIFVSHREMSAAMRTLAEEAGFKEKDAKLFYVGFSQTDDDPCRDSRYGRVYNGETRMYGHVVGRISSAHTLCCVFHCDPPSNPVPEDQEECGKPTILPISSIRRNFRVGGLFEPAFPAHVDQMAAVLNFIENYGPTFNPENCAK
jgi:hypothetical protein